MPRADLGTIGGFKINPALTDDDFKRFKEDVDQDTWMISEGRKHIEALEDRHDWPTDDIDSVKDFLNHLLDSDYEVSGFAPVSGHEWGNYIIGKSPDDDRFTDLFEVSIRPSTAEDLRSLKTAKAKSIAVRLRRIADWVETGTRHLGKISATTASRGRLDREMCQVIAHFLTTD